MSKVFEDVEEEIDQSHDEGQSCTVVSLCLFDIIETRSYGIYRIPAAPFPTDDNPMPYKMVKIKDADDMIDFPLDNRREPRLVRCRDIARDITSSYRNQGVFVAKGPRPTNQELAAADAVRTAYFDAKIQEADGWWESLQPMNRLQIGDEHRRAGKFRKVERAWMFPVRQGRLVSCRFCKSDIVEGTAICPHCHETIDHKLLNELRAEGQEKPAKEFKEPISAVKRV